MLFILNVSGVPSVAKIVQVGSGAQRRQRWAPSRRAELSQADPFTLRVNGGNFVSGSVVRWNGADRTTTFVSSTQLTAQISAGDIAAVGIASVTVLNPGGAVSNALSFTITQAPPPPTLAITANSLPEGRVNVAC